MTAQLRIAFLSEHASPLAVRGGVDAGGQNVYVDKVGRNLGRLGYAVDVFTRRDSHDVPEVVDLAPGVRVVHVPAGPPKWVFKDQLWPYMPTFRDAIMQFVERDNRPYDLVHGNFWMSGWVAAELQRRYGIPAVQTFHATGLTKRRHQGADDTSPRERIAVEREIVGTVQRLIAQCPAEHAELVDDYGADPTRVAVIPSAVDVETYRPLPRDEARRRIGLQTNGPVVVYVGRMLPRKDVRNVVRAMALLARESDPAVGAAMLLLVGGETADADPRATPEIGELQRLAAELGIAARLRFVGRRQPEELYLYYSAGDVAVTTPWYEPFGLTPLEAMACARPVIGSAVGGLMYTIRDGETGFLVPPRDPPALAQRLRLLLRDRDLRERLGRAGRERVLRHFTWPLVAARTGALYQQILERPSPSTYRDWAVGAAAPTARPTSPASGRGGASG